MPEEQKVVETKTETATTQQEVDLAKELEETRQQLAKKTEVAENYKRGMLKAKGKIPGDDQMDDGQPEDMEEKMRRIAREEQANSEVAQLQAKEKAQLDAILKRNKELELALRNRGQITNTSAGGSNEDKPEVKTDSYFSPEQIAGFKKQGKSDAWIETVKKNMIKESQMPKIINN